MKTPTLIALLALLLPAITFAQSDEADPATAKAERQLAEAAAAEYRRLQQDAPATTTAPKASDKTAGTQSNAQNHGRRLSSLRVRLQETEQRRIRDRYQQARLALIAKTHVPDTAAKHTSELTMSAGSGK